MNIVRMGNSVLEDGHNALASQITALWDCWRGSHDRAEIVVALKAFIAHLRGHFALEEVIVGGAGFDGLSEHVVRHQQIIEEVMAWRTRLIEDLTLPPHQVVQSVEKMLCEHEMVEDQSYIPCLSHSSKSTDGEKRSLFQGHGEPLTGDPLIDAHHRALTFHADRLTTLAQQGNFDVFCAALHDFRSLAAHHFRVEDEMLAKIEDVSAQQHREAHVGLLRSLDTVVRRVEMRKMPPTAFVEDFLSFWMFNHITENDMEHFRKAPFDHES